MSSVGDGTFTVTATGTEGGTVEVLYRFGGGDAIIGGSRIGDGDLTVSGRDNGVDHKVWLQVVDGACRGIPSDFLILTPNAFVVGASLFDDTPEDFLQSLDDIGKDMVWSKDGGDIVARKAIITDDTKEQVQGPQGQIIPRNSIWFISTDVLIGVDPRTTKDSATYDGEIWSVTQIVREVGGVAEIEMQVLKEVARSRPDRRRKRGRS